jgi:hypothetical protein
MRISRNYVVEDYTRLTFRSESDWQRATAILRDRLETRYLEHVRAILERPTSGFAALALDAALVETLEQFRRGRRRTPQGDGAKYFRAFLTETRFGQYFDEVTAKLFYRTIRCGLLHHSEADESSRIKRGSRYPLVCLTKDRRGIVVNVELFHSELEDAIEDYLAKLADPAEVGLREAFRKKMDFICRRERQPPGVPNVVH